MPSCRKSSVREFGSSLENLGCRLVLVLLEILLEETSQLLNLTGEVLFGAAPAAGGVEQIIGNVGARLGDG